MTMHARNAAMIRKLVLIVTTNSPAIPKIIYFPTTGIAAIHMAATKIRRYSLTGSGCLSALRPP